MNIRMLIYLWDIFEERFLEVEPNTKINIWKRNRSLFVKL